jgi:hypothetical protein
MSTMRSKYSLKVSKANTNMVSEKQHNVIVNRSAATCSVKNTRYNAAYELNKV